MTACFSFWGKNIQNKALSVVWIISMPYILFPKKRKQNLKLLSAASSRWHYESWLYNLLWLEILLPHLINSSRTLNTGKSCTNKIVPVQNGLLFDCQNQITQRRKGCANKIVPNQPYIRLIWNFFLCTSFSSLSNITALLYAVWLGTICYIIYWCQGLISQVHQLEDLFLAHLSIKGSTWA